MEVEKIYFDMDGVLADFGRGVREICGMVPPSLNAKHHVAGEDDEMWARIKENAHFYDRLELMPGAKELFDAVYGRYGSRCEILTGIPKPWRGIDTAGEDKTRWVRRLLSEDIVMNIVLRAEKVQYCGSPRCVLIDDMQRSIREWREKGGIGILHTSVEETTEQLRKLGIL